MKRKLHDRLQRQIRAHLGGVSRLSKKWKAFLASVNEAYHQDAEDRAMVEMSLESATQELLRRNLQLTKDIHQRIEAQRVIRENEIRFRILADSAPVLIWMSGATGGFTYVNKTWTDFTGRPVEAEIGEGWREVVDAGDREALSLVYADAFRSQEGFSLEVRMRRADGVNRWIWLTGTPRSTPDGIFQGLIGTGVDITERRQMEKQLHAGGSRLQRQNRSLMNLAKRAGNQANRELEPAIREIAEVAASTIDADRTSVWFFEGNGDSLRCFDGYVRSRNLHESGSVLTVADHQALFASFKEERSIAADNVRVDPRTKSLGTKGGWLEGLEALLCAPILLHGRAVGAVICGHSGASRAWTSDEQQFLVSLSDLTALAMEAHERHWAENALLTSEERFQLVARATNDAVWDWDLLTDSLWSNEGVKTLFGYGDEDVGKTGEWWKSLLHPEDREKVMDSLRANIDRGKDLWSCDYRLKKADGTYAFVLDRGYVIRGVAGKAVRMIRATTDLSERRAMEVRMLQSEKLSAMGQLAAGIAHEVNNPLGVILGFAQGVLRRLTPDDPRMSSLKAIERETLRCKALVHDLLEFARASNLQRETVDMNDCIDGALPLVEVNAKMHKVEIRKVLGEGLPPISGNKNQFQQIIINLGNNAIDAMEDGGLLTVQTELLLDRAGAWVCLHVIDTGTGIPDHVMPKIFEPFFTTKPVGKGTGLGLSLVYEIIKKYEGTIETQSRPGRTEFVVRFPVLAEEEK